jgi:hypothetical protein
MLLTLTCLVLPIAPTQAPTKTWHTDYATAQAEAKKSGKPMLVVIRCPQCTDHRKIDEQLLKLDPVLAQAASKYVLLRLTRLSGLDLRIFDFDYDLSWFVFLMNAEHTIYARYGGRDAADAEARISLNGLNAALRAGLEIHKSPPPAVKRPGAAKRVEDIVTGRKQGCIHCHNILESERAVQKKAGTWNKEKVWMYPLPENIGLSMEVDEGNIVRSVGADSPAAKIGIQSGDRITSVQDLPVWTQADLQYALHSAQGEIRIMWSRAGKSQQGRLDLPAGWRKTDLSWRSSLLDLLPYVPFSGEELTEQERAELALPSTQAAFRQDKFLHSSLKDAGMQANDIIVGLDGQTYTGTMKTLLQRVRGYSLSGDELTVNILRAGKPQSVKVLLK